MKGQFKKYSFSAIAIIVLLILKILWLSFLLIYGFLIFDNYASIIGLIYSAYLIIFIFMYLIGLIGIFKKTLWALKMLFFVSMVDVTIFTLLSSGNNLLWILDYVFMILLWFLMINIARRIRTGDGVIKKRRSFLSAPTIQERKLIREGFFILFPTLILFFLVKELTNNLLFELLALVIGSLMSRFIYNLFNKKYEPGKDRA